MPKITPFLWYDNNAEEAANFYVSIFKSAKVLNVNRMGGKVLTVNFEIEGQQFTALNGGPYFKFTEAFSIFVSCNTQEEVDEYWNKLLEGGTPSRCGWLKDKFGLSWQIIPKALMQLMGAPDREKSNAVFQAMMKMDKIIVADLQKAFEGKAA
ncbi:MAG TPA: VOC family protein [Candidatus Binatia bacterium]|nr:VOC family protein [Candidatus Binatia bacterium]